MEPGLSWNNLQKWRVKQMCKTLALVYTYYKCLLRLYLWIIPRYLASSSL